MGRNAPAQTNTGTNSQPASLLDRQTDKQTYEHINRTSIGLRMDIPDPRYTLLCASLVKAVKIAPSLYDIREKKRGVILS